MPRPLAAALPASGLWALAGSVLLLSSAWPVTRLAVGLGADSLWFAEGRAVLSGLTAFVLLAALRRLRLPGRADLPTLLAVGLLQLAAFFALAHAAVAWVPAGRTAVLSNTTTIWLLPLSLLVLKEAIPPRRWIATGLGMAGVVVLVGPWAIVWRQRSVVVGHGFLLLASLAWSIAILVVRLRPPRLSMLQLLPWCFALASVALLPLALTQPLGRWPRGALTGLGLVGLVAGPLGTWCVMQAASVLPAVVASLGFLCAPASALLLAVVLLHERLDAGLLAGSALILAGVAVAAWPGRRAALADSPAPGRHPA